MRIVFMMKHPGTVRNFESTLRLLAQRGHDLELAFDNDKVDGPDTGVRDLLGGGASVTTSRAPKPGRRRIVRTTRALRLTEDYLRYLEPRYTGAVKLRARARAQAPPRLVALAGAPLLRGGPGARGLARAVTGLERRLPPPDSVVAWLRERRPDVLVVSPLIGLGSRQADHVRAARELGIPVVFPVHSWDNLTNKGLLRDPPDSVLVWSEAQAQEAVQLHGVPRDRVTITGAPSFDRWFGRLPSRDRAACLAQIGLAEVETLVLYVCSSPFIAPDEVAFVRNWIAALRDAADPLLCDAGVLVRPHPQNAAQWHDADLGDPRTTVWPRAGANPDHEAARNDFFDSLYHASAVVGINTSALIEAAIVDRPVFTVLDAQFAHTQEGTLHFRHLAADDDGMLHVARSLEEHVAQLGAALADDAPWRARNRRFVEAFVRPHGIGTAVTPLVADAVERAAGAELVRTPAGERAARLWLGRGSRTWRRTLRLARRGARLALRAGDRADPAATAPSTRNRRRPAEPDAVDEARAAVRRLAEETGGPILAGPWVSEVGYELMYWVPFLRWAIEEHPGLAERLVVVSRGGSAHWYEQLGVRYAELLDLYGPDELRERREAAALEATGGLNKQMTETAFDAQLLAEVAARLELGDHEILHPSLMYRGYWRLVKRRELVSPDGGELFRYRPLAAPPAGVLDGALPDEFVAVRFYFRASFPETEENVAFARTTVEALAEQTDVVLLNPSIQVDDHWDFEPAGDGRIIRLDHLMTPQTNLAVQTAAIARASAFVGTYGGLAYLPPLLGVRSESVFTDPARFKHHHLELAQAVFGEPGFGSFAVHDVRGVDAQALLSTTVLG